MGSRVVFDGLSQFRQALRNLPEGLRDEASDIVEGTAAEAATDVQQNYAEGPTGNLRRGVTRKSERSRFGLSVQVRSRAQHSWIYERGTQQRRTKTGANRGRMPEAPESKRMIPIVIRHRRRMIEKLKDLVRRAGFQVD